MLTYYLSLDDISLYKRCHFRQKFSLKSLSDNIFTLTSVFLPLSASGL